MLRILLCCCLSGSFGGITCADEPRGNPDPSQIERGEKLFAGKILPLLKSKCWACHGDDPKGELKGKLDLKTRTAMLKGGASGEPSLVPGKPDESLLIQAINWDGYEMPPKENDRLTKTEIEYFREWILADAPWPDAKRLTELQKESWEAAEGVAVVTSGGQSEEWTRRKYDPVDLWAYQPITQPAVPETSANPVDAFLDLRLKQANLNRAVNADKLTLIRRATFDLTGLPPSPDEIRHFLNDESPKAFEKVVDRLLASPHYGEHMARHWLDVVRYADTAGFSNDFERPNAWRYRDYVIRSFNRDKP
ncbi:MAG TPA: DUF1549 domain-containing protein, partial [Planctomycetaceae bacterium]|nr:DUF1549 domain-containing protein [Planctomycetaceae bacterium]